MSEAAVNPIIETVMLFAVNRPAIHLYNDKSIMFESISIFESINKAYITGNIIIVDSAGMLEGYPITGDEYLHISFRSSKAAKPYIKIFKVYKVDNVTDVESKRTQSYILYFASTIMDESQKKKLRISFKDKREDEIIKSICKHTLLIDESALDFEETLFQRTFVIPNWSPLKTIDYFTKTAIWSGNSRSSSFVFYEDVDGWNFKSLESIMRDDAFTTLSLLNMADRHTDFKQNNIISYEIEKSFDNIQNSQKGYYGSVAREVDLINKKVVDIEYKHQNLHDVQIDIDNGLSNHHKNLAWPIRNNIGDDTKRKTTMVSNNGNNLHSADTTNKRAWFMQQFENYKVNVTMFGNSAFKTGVKIKFNNKSLRQTPREEEQKYLSGNFILTDMWHRITPTEHRMMLTLRKPTFRNKISVINEGVN